MLLLVFWWSSPECIVANHITIIVPSEQLRLASAWFTSGPGVVLIHTGAKWLPDLS